jgi:hypothetical protein
VSRALVSRYLFTEAAASQSLASTTGTNALTNGATGSVEGTDLTLDGMRAQGTGAGYAISAQGILANMTGDFSALACFFAVAAGTILNLANPASNTAYIGINVATASTMSGNQNDGTTKNTGTIAFDNTKIVCASLVMSSSTLTIRNERTGAQASTAAGTMSGAPRLGIGATVRTSPFNFIPTTTYVYYVSLFSAALTSGELQREAKAALRYLSSISAPNL